MTKENRQSTFARLDENGDIEVIDVYTGQVVKHQKRSMEELVESAAVQVTTPDGRMVWVERGMDLDKIFSKSKCVWKYGAVMRDMICQKVREGKTIAAVARYPGFPPADVMYAWRREHDDFKEAFNSAVIDRAEYFQTKIIDEADNLEERDDVPVAKAKIEAYKWIAEKDDPDKFGTRTKVVGDPNAPLKWIIDTGIQREKKEVEIELEKIEDKSDES